MRTTPVLSLLTSLALLGCPSPPDQQEGGGNATAQGGDAGNPTGGGQQGTPGGQPVADDAGPGPANGMAEPLDLSQDMEQTQEQVAAGEHFTVSGEVKGKCKGNLRIDVIGATAAPASEGRQDEEAPQARLLTASNLEAVGEFSIAVPKGEFDMIEIAALCDMDGDKKITGGTDAISGPKDASNLEEDTSGVILKLEKLPKPVEPEEGEPPEEATGAADERGHIPAEGEDPDAGAQRPEGAAGGGDQPPQQHPPNEQGAPPVPPADGQPPTPPQNEGEPPPGE